MLILKYILYLGIVNIIFSFLWKWIFLIPVATLLAILKLDKYGILVIKTFGTYLLVSITTILTLSFIVSEDLRGLKLVLYIFVGAFALFIILAGSEYEKRKIAYKSNDYELQETIQGNQIFDSVLIILAILFFIMTLFIPSLSINYLTKDIFKIIDWIHNLPVIGWLIGIGGILFLINVAFYGLIASISIIAGVIKKLTFSRETIKSEKSISRFFKDRGSIYRLDVAEDGGRSVFELKDGKEMSLPEANGLELEMEGEEIEQPKRSFKN